MSRFSDFGLDDRILKAIEKQKWDSTTLIQEKAIPLILSGKDVLLRARTGSGKTGAFLIPCLQRILDIKINARVQCVRCVIVAPTKELCHQINQNVLDLACFCRRELCSVNIGSQEDYNVIRSLLSDKPDVVVGTPTRILNILKKNILNLKESLDILIVDEADLVFSFGCEEDMKEMVGYLPSVYQAILASATLSEDVIQLKKLVLHNPVLLKLQEPPVPPSCQLAHYVIRAEEEDKYVIIYALFKLTLVRGKSLIFVNNVDRCYKLKLFLEQFGLSACVLNSELPQLCRWNAIQAFNQGSYNIIIASDDRYLSESDKLDSNKNSEASTPASEKGDSALSDSKKRFRKRNADKDSGVSRGIDFQFVSNVINFDFPLATSSYLHRVGRTARGNNQGAAVSFVARKEEEILSRVDEKLKELSHQDEEITMQPFNFRMDEVEGFRYRARDALKSVTRIAIREARLKEISQEMLNSKELKEYFSKQPNALKALKHDMPTKIIKAQQHLKHIPDYIIPKTLRQSRASTFSGRNITEVSNVSHTKRRKNRNKKYGGRISKKKKDPLESMQFKGIDKINKKKKT